MHRRPSNTHSSARQQDPPTGGYFFLLPHKLSQSKQLIDEQPCVCVTVGEEHTRCSSRKRCVTSTQIPFLHKAENQICDHLKVDDDH